MRVLAVTTFECMSEHGEARKFTLVRCSQEGKLASQRLTSKRPERILAAHWQLSLEKCQLWAEEDGRVSL